MPEAVVAPPSAADAPVLDPQPELQPQPQLVSLVPSGGDVTPEVGTGGCPGCQGPDPTATGNMDHSPVLEGGGGPVRISHVRAPRRIRNVLPTYPPNARNIGLQGDVLLDCTIGVDGVVRDVRILSGHQVFHHAAREAVLRWVYTPTMLGGQPVSVLLTVTVHFRLQR
jgi:protein TonB